MSTLTYPRRGSTVGAALRRRLASLGLTLAAGGAAVLAGDLVARESRLVHAVLALILAGTLVLMSMRTPRIAVVAMLLLLPFLAFGRRLLILYDGWHSADPLLLVGPAVAAAIVLHRRFGGVPPQASGRISRLVLGLLVLAVLGSINPLGGSLLAGLAGLLFVAAPLLWFFVGRDVVDRATVKLVIGGAIFAAIVVAVYGLSQTLNGMSPWDAAWVRERGYAALRVGDVIRPFATFSSAGEYATFLAIAIAACIALALHGRVYALAPLPILVPALFLVGSRGIVVIAAAVGIGLVGLRMRLAWASIAVIAIMLAGLTFALESYGRSLTARGENSDNALVEHQAGGLAHPLDPEKSTLMIHVELVVGGFTEALRHPLGLGTGATNIGGSRFGGVNAGTEIDISNAFVSLGLPGGLLFLAVILTTLRAAFAAYRDQGDVVVFVVLAALLVTLGQWLNGGYYAVAPLVWILVGWIARVSSSNTGQALEARRA